MKTLRCSAAAIVLLSFAPAAPGQTDGSVALKAIIHDFTGASDADHYALVWVTNNAGTFIKTLWKQGPSFTNSEWGKHCSAWNTARGTSTALDGFSGATAQSYTGTIASPATNNPIDPVWNCRDASNSLVPDGTYKFYIQYAEDASGQGPLTTAISWTKGPSAFSQTYPNQGTTGSPQGGSNFTDISVTWTPTVVAAPEIAVEQPAGTNIADNGSKSFPSVEVGSNTSLTFTIRNTGTANLTGLTVTKDGSHAADFTVTASPTAPVAAGGNTTFTVRFTPSAPGTRTAAIHIANNDADENPFDINLSGTGTAPEIAVEQPAGTNLADAATKDFGTVTLGSPVSLSFTVRNTGTSNLTGLTVTKDGSHAADFTVTASPTAPVAAGGSTTFTVQFAPTAAGTRTAAIHLANNDPDENPFDINLSGTAVTAFEAWASASGLPGGQSGANQTPQNDGVTNLLKYAFNLDPLKPDVRMLRVGSGDTAGLPGGALVAGKLRLEFLRRNPSTNPGITYTPQFTGSPGGTWTDYTGAPLTVTPVDATWDRVVVDDLPPVGATARFARVKVTQP